MWLGGREGGAGEVASLDFGFESALLGWRGRSSRPHLLPYTHHLTLQPIMEALPSCELPCVQFSHSDLS